MNTSEARHISPSDATFIDAVRANQVSILVHVAEQALSTPSYDDLLDSIIDSLSDIFDAREVRLYLSSSETLYFRELSCRARKNTDEESLFLPSGTGRIDQLTNLHQVVIVDSHAPHPNDVMVDLMAASGFRTSVVTPIFTSQKNLGMCVIMLDRACAWSRHDVEFLLSIGRLLGVLVERGRHDGVTVSLNSLRECNHMIEDIRDSLSKLLTSAESDYRELSVEKQRTYQDKSPTPPDTRLTLREKDIMRYVSQGLSNKEIGELTFVSDSTIKRQLADLLKKLGLRNRAHLAAYAVRTGIAE